MLLNNKYLLIWQLLRIYLKLMDARLFKLGYNTFFKGTMFVVKVLLVFASFVFSIDQVQAQSEKKIQKWFGEAKQLFRLEEFNESVEFCNKIVTANPTFVDAHLLLADIYNQIDSTKQEIYHLKEAKKNSSIALIVFRIAEAYFSEGIYSEALGYYNDYLSLNNISDTRKKEVNQRIASCHFAIEALKNPVDFYPERLSGKINSVNDEYWPSLSLDGETLVFTRLVKDNILIPQEDFFASKLDSTGWGDAKPILGINTRGNEGAQTLSADGRFMFFTACNRSDGYGSCDIYYSVFSNGKWSKPLNAGSPLNSNAWEAQPTFSSDSRYLYFSSDRKDGKGKKDIWRSELLSFTEAGEIEWAKPENLGEIINTWGNEISPFIHPNNSDFYFISDNHAGMGGFDIFKCELFSDSIYTKPQNLGYPINTLQNEQGLVISADGLTGYFSAQRNEETGMDIYNFRLDKSVRPKPVTYIKLNVIDAQTNKPLQCDIDLINLSHYSSDYKTGTTDLNGELMLCLPLGADYAFNVSKENYLFYSQAFPLLEQKKITEPFILTLELEPVRVGAEMNLYNIYFETDSFTILPESEPELQRLCNFLTNNIGLNVEIQGHTDSSGSFEKNQKLSEQRAQSVVNYLVDSGIEKERLSAKGFGDTVPVKSNETVEGRRQNRRTTIKIIAN